VKIEKTRKEVAAELWALAALEDDARAATGVDGRCMACGADIGHGLAHLDSCGYSVLAAPPPDLAPLRELVAAIREVTRDADYPDERLRDPYNALLAAYPCLGEE
jgi:hypothetical protein